MSAELIDGKAIAATIRSEIKAEVDAMQAVHQQVPGLATVLVGARKDSQTYVRMKKKACAEVGIHSYGHDLPGDISQADLLEVVQALNANPDVHGILVQLPLPDLDFIKQHVTEWPVGEYHTVFLYGNGFAVFANSFKPGAQTPSDRLVF